MIRFEPIRLTHGSLTVRAAAQRLGVGYSTLKQWIYTGKVRTTTTAGGHHRIADAEIERLIAQTQAPLAAKATPARPTGLIVALSGRNRLRGFVEEVRRRRPARRRCGCASATRRSRRSSPRRRRRAEAAARRRCGRDHQVHRSDDRAGAAGAACQTEAEAEATLLNCGMWQPR